MATLDAILAPLLLGFELSLYDVKPTDQLFLVYSGSTQQVLGNYSESPSGLLRGSLGTTYWIVHPPSTMLRVKD